LKRRPGSRPTPRELQLEEQLRLLQSRRAGEGLAAVLNSLFRAGGAVGVTYFGVYRTAEALAGKTTWAHISVPELAKVAAEGGHSWISIAGVVLTAIPWLVMGGAVLYGLRERRLRHDTVQRLHGRIEELEKRLNPTRTSSTLTTRGETREEDRL
jgi:hypothetical protein